MGAFATSCDSNATSEITGSGTANYVAMFTAAQVIGNSSIYSSSTAAAIGTTSIDSSAILQLNSTSLGFLPPRMTTAQRDAMLAPADGLLVYNTTTDNLNYYDATVGVGWVQFVTTISGLTSGRVPFVTTGGRLTDASNFTFSGTRLSPNYITLAAGTASAGTAPLVFTSGTSLTAAIAGAMEFTTDDLFFTITTGAARKNVTLWDTLGISTRVPYATTNGRLTDSANMTYSGTRLSPNYITLAAGTSSAGTAPLIFTSGTSLSSAVAGAVEFTTDDLFFTITTGSARKRLLMADPVGGLTSGRVPYTTTNGRLTDAASLTFDAVTLTHTATLTGTAVQTGEAVNITTSSTAPSSQYTALYAKLLPGYTGTAVTCGIEVDNTVAGTGANLNLASTGSNVTGNTGISTFSYVSTVGYNVGVFSETAFGNYNVGVIGKSITSKASVPNVGVMGIAANGGASGISIGGYFALGASATPTLTGLTAVLVLDNFGTTNPIQIWQSNSSVVGRMINGGYTFLGGSTTPTAVLHLAAGTATASTAPLKFTSGTNLATGEAGAMEYNGTNLFFTRTGTTRQTVLTANVVTTEALTSDTSITINVAGTDYKLLAKA